MANEVHGKAGRVKISGSEVVGIKDWTLTLDQPLVSATNFADGVSGTGERFRPGIQKWSGSFAGAKTGVPLDIVTLNGSGPTTIELDESQTAGQKWTGSVWFSKISPKANTTGLVEYTYDFTGDGALTIPTA